jgi:hypothetical protein
VVKPGYTGAPLEHLSDPRGGHLAPPTARPEPRQPGQLVPGPQPQVALERGAGLRPEGQDAHPVALAADGDLVGLHVQVVEPDPAHLRHAHPGVDEHPHDGLVAAVGELLAGARCDECLELVVGQHPYWFLGRLRWAQPRHRIGLDPLLGGQPAVELLQRLEPDRRSARGVGAQQEDHEVLDVGRSDLLQGDAATQPTRQQPGGLQVALHGLVRLLRRSQPALERPQRRGIGRRERAGQQWIGCRHRLS